MAVRIKIKEVTGIVARAIAAASAALTLRVPTDEDPQEGDYARLLPVDARLVIRRSVDEPHAAEVTVRVVVVTRPRGAPEQAYRHAEQLDKVLAALDLLSAVENGHTVQLDNPSARQLQDENDPSLFISLIEVAGRVDRVTGS